MTSRINQLQELLQKEPNDSFLNYALALEYSKLNEKEKAVELIVSLLLRDENYLGAYYQLGQLYEQTNQLEKAREAYSKGMVIGSQQKNHKAVGELKTALSLIEEM